MSAELKQKLMFLGICLAAVSLLYGRTLAGDFVFDDRGIVEHQALLSNLNQLDKMLTLPYWTEEAGLYRPITLASYTFNYLLFGSGPAGFHFVNLLLHALTGFLIYLLVDKLFKRRLLAYLTALIFLLLPIHSEAVANIIGRAEILALLFSLLAFLSLLKEPQPNQGGLNLKNYWPAGVWLFLAIGSKETAIAALPIAAVMIYAKEKIFWSRENFYKYLPAAAWSAAGLAAYFGLRFLVLGGEYFLKSVTSMVENPLQFVSAGPRIITALNILTLYLKKSFWPLGLCSDYSYNQLPVLHNFFNAGTLIGLAVLSLAVVGVFLVRRAPIISLAAAIFLFGFLPTANLFFPTGTIMGERLAYFPSLGFSLLLAYGLNEIFKFRGKIMAKYLAVGLFAALAVFYGAVSFLRAGDWLTEKRLFASAAGCAPLSVLSRSNLGASYYLAGDLVNAKKELLAAREIYDGYPKGINNLGLVYWKEGDLKTARQLFLKALSFKFPYYGAYENLALVSLAEGKIKEARLWLMLLYSGDKATADNYIENYLTAEQSGAN